MIESANSRFIGIHNSSDLQPLLKLNPVVDHNLFDLNLIPVTAKWLSVRHAVFHRGDFFVFEPFKPDNLMHVLHDDLLPAYLTMYKLCHGEMGECVRRWRPLLRSDSLPSPLAPLYAALWDNPPTLTGDLDPATPHCFERSHVGLRSDSLWYQYGFERPQSPLPTPYLQREHLDDFRAHLLSRLGATVGGGDPQPPQSGYVLLLSRTESRLILNEAALSAALAARLGRPVRRLALEETSLSAAAALAAGAHLLVGMHGAGLALALLLPPGGAVLELFPYGLRPERYRPYQRLCQLRGLGYRAWVNTDPASSVVPGPEATPDRGGIGHLDDTERQRVQTLQEVPETLCCSDPAFLYRVYQDTMVNTAAVSAAAEAALASARSRRRRTRGALFFPGPARHLTAQAEGDSRLLEWRPPVNAAPEVVSYRVWVRQGERVGEYRVRRPRLTVAAECGLCRLQVWVRTEVDGRPGPVAHETFELDEPPV
ncbi:Protein O-linked-mannose beta-1,4-N-acetylglucosaminyltransferase 2 [Amphibalanus amphitrite]|uniref:Protein O-linked-mannose beta-1,4-N-acetylglucosaminyltransferase 2 n=1 Tax=Amphibalanus amphitrite TaxID=1232801 RepID=A0A6A4WFL5_AMPAM|nr:Protein O-linked-mannose beta-1,4-N-acetylglucosaminyltransferase 2 [Amphibalanus amphitrite]